MKSKIKITLLSFFLLISAWGNIAAFDFNKNFSKLSFNQDVGEPDTVYVSCSNDPNLPNVIEIRIITDNTGPGDSVVGVFIPLVITTDQSQVALDTQVINAYAGTAMSDWSIKVVNVFTSGNSYPGDPAVFPMRLIVGGYDGIPIYHQQLGRGNHLLARLIFTLAESTMICLDTTTNVGNGIPLHGTTRKPEAFFPEWKGNCCILFPLRGDVDYDSDVSLSDVVYLLNYLLGKPGNWTLKSAKVADFNCDGQVLLSDLVILINFIFKGQPIPCK